MMINPPVGFGMILKIHQHERRLEIVPLPPGVMFGIVFKRREAYQIIAIFFEKI